MKMTTNRCINVLQSSERQRMHYAGPWLPEPMPEEAVERRDSIRYAMLVLLQTLTPRERAVFILRDSLGFSYGDIAETVERTESHCRQIFSRAKRKIGEIPQEARDGSHNHADKAARLFIEAIETGRFHDLIQQLVHDVTLTTDGGGKTRAAFKPILGKARVLAFLQGIRKKGGFAGKLHPVPLNGETGLVLVRSPRHVMSIHFDWDAGGKIRSIYFVMNPDKLHKIG